MADTAVRRPAGAAPALRIAPRTLRVLLGFCVLVAWEVLPRSGAIPTLFLPSLSDTLAALADGAPEYGRHLLFTLRAIAVSMAVACGLGIGAGLLIGSVARLRRIVQPLASGLYAVPLVILYPLFTAWFGIGPQSKIVFASLYGLLPCLLGTIAGVQTIDRQYLLVARSLRATRRQTVLRVLLPAAIPTVLTSLRIGGALVIVGVVVAEMLTSAEGIGYLITRSRTLLDSPRVFAGILLVVAMVFAFDGLVRLLDHRTRHWRLSTRSGDGGA
ncbi:NitT/TauT family transport system permease protein/taurine transport system permease protein [Tistlia consotensis]|uniref:NitT/TauT family transport system permease protein/taurine transport system permease protein n=1 Tax=Tistlia consotensis USBA 355 TaxID=560819 RepID=A0A1Y6C493_9PROT|nr:ABC transporter permease [Tistlia consotensis]SMF36400.1 NitT/TauT family transport system permease protein/taurine transport system permease protein [Tistlia consotensis USBA 355]SNR71824.1 NitT/TauT family transport system permease protein/taurine transport system permease protein [Tistlia consotensis]